MLHTQHTGVWCKSRGLAATMLSCGDKQSKINELQLSSHVENSWRTCCALTLLWLMYLKKLYQLQRLFRYSNSIKNTVPLQAGSGPEGSRKLRFPDFVTTAQEGGKVVSLTHRPPLPPGNAPGTHFCYKLSRPQGRSANGRILCQWHRLGSNQWPYDL